MSLETVVEDIREEARERREEIVAEAEADADEIVAEAEDDADAIIAEAEAEVEEEIEQEREQKLSSAKLEAKQERLQARREALAEVRDAVEDEVAAIDGDERRDLTADLLAATADEFDEGSVSVYGRPADQDLLEELLADYDGYEYAGEYDCLGGVVAESETSRVRVNNTFDSILDDVWEDNLKAVSQRLFDQ